VIPGHGHQTSPSNKTFRGPPAASHQLERVDGETKRRREVISSFANEVAFIQLIGTPLLDWNNEWVVQLARCIRLEAIAPLSDDPVVSLPRTTA
jgi:putative transposase